MSLRLIAQENKEDPNNVPGEYWELRNGRITFYAQRNKQLIFTVFLGGVGKGVGVDPHLSSTIPIPLDN